MSNFKSLWIAPSRIPVAADDIAVEVSPLYNRHRDAHTEEENRCILDVWRARQAEASRCGGMLFNGTKFRLDGVRVADTSTQDGTGPLVTLLLGITDYRSLCGTNFTDRNRPPVAGGGTSWSEASMSDALGVEALLLSSDNFVVLFKRSAKVADNPGWYCCPGGHPEPCHAIRSRPDAEASLSGIVSRFPATASNGFRQFDDADSHADPVGDAETLYDALAEAMDPIRTRSELFDSILDEIADETGAPRGSLHNEGLVAVIRADGNNRGKPDLVFRVRTTLSAVELDSAFRSGAASEAEEVDGTLMLVPVDDIRERNIWTPPGNLAAPSLACLQLCL